jgi:hypothetical protein
LARCARDVWPNPDRTVENPNCQSNGSQFGIFDHELAFRTEGVLFWKPPWEKSGINFPKAQPDRSRHVFVDHVRGTEPNFPSSGNVLVWSGSKLAPQEETNNPL